MGNWQGCVVVAGLAGVLACGGDSTEEVVREALAASSIAGVEVEVSADAVRLTGTVETLADRSRAVEIAASIVGPSTPVENDITVSGLGPPRDGGTRRPAAGTEP